MTQLIFADPTGWNFMLSIKTIPKKNGQSSTAVKYLPTFILMTAI
jgi:hypothetical protein